MFYELLGGTGQEGSREQRNNPTLKGQMVVAPDFEVIWRRKAPIWGRRALRPRDRQNPVHCVDCLGPSLRRIDW